MQRNTFFNLFILATLMIQSGQAWAKGYEDPHDLLCKVYSTEDAPVLFKAMSNFNSAVQKHRLELEKRFPDLSARLKPKIFLMNEKVGRMEKVMEVDEQIVIGNDPILLLAVEKADRIGRRIATENCESEHITDDAQDALRHFAVSAVLSALIGKDRALEIMTTHEIAGFKRLQRFNEVTTKQLFATFMDEANNFHGAKFGESFQASKNKLSNSSDDEIFRKLAPKVFSAFKEKLASKNKDDQIVVLAGERVCRKPSSPFAGCEGSNCFIEPDAEPVGASGSAQ